jgi:AcrR family transcriptional regulator
VRDIAARADVNATFVHRYFGSKQGLMHAAMSRAQQHILEQVEDMPDVEDGGAVFRASLQEREFIAALARATLDGVFTGVPAGSPAIARLLERFQAELEQRGTHGRHDARIVVACLAATTAGYARLGSYIRHGTGLEDRPDVEVQTELLEVLRDVARLAFRA